jgi:hypothetical protein
MQISKPAARNSKSFILTEPTTGFPRFAFYKQQIHEKITEISQCAGIIDLEFNSLGINKGGSAGDTSAPSKLTSNFLGVPTYHLGSFINLTSYQR